MRKYLTTGLFSAILGIVIGGAPADAALVSRGFLDEALENYATTTALDLKADNADLTNLSNKIGELPDGITLENFYKGWVDSGGESMAKYIATQGGKGMVYIYNPVNDDFGPQRFPDVGYLDVLAKLIGGDGFTPAENSALAPFWYLTKQAMRVGEIPRDKTAAGMIDEINTKIGTLPDGYETVGATLTAIKGIAEDAKAAALSAIPDPKTEGSTGKFVLTVDIVGDNATYRWEKIDREGEATTTTE